MSPYLYIALGITALCKDYWTAVGPYGLFWAQTSIEILPSLLGFSIGGMAIMLAFSEAKIFAVITQKGNERSFFLTVVANFFHFIFIQVLALALALVAKAHTNDVLSFFGFWLSVYAILVALATAGQLLRTAEVFNKAGGLPNDNGKSAAEKKEK